MDNTAQVTLTTDEWKSVIASLEDSKAGLYRLASTRKVSSEVRTLTKGQIELSKIIDSIRDAIE